MDTGDGELSKWLFEHLEWILSAVGAANIGVVGWLIRNGRKEVKTDDHLAAHDEAVKDMRKHMSRFPVETIESTKLGFARVDAKFDIFGGEFRSYREAAASQFATRTELKRTEDHITETLRTMTASQTAVMQRVDRLDDKVDERFDRLTDLIIKQHPRGG